MITNAWALPMCKYKSLSTLFSLFYFKNIVFKPTYIKNDNIPILNFDSSFFVVGKKKYTLSYTLLQYKDFHNSINTLEILRMCFLKGSARGKDLKVLYETRELCEIYIHRNAAFCRRLSTCIIFGFSVGTSEKSYTWKHSAIYWLVLIGKPRDGNINRVYPSGNFLFFVLSYCVNTFLLPTNSVWIWCLCFPIERDGSFRRNSLFIFSKNTVKSLRNAKRLNFRWQDNNNSSRLPTQFTFLTNFNSRCLFKLGSYFLFFSGEKCLHSFEPSEWRRKWCSFLDYNCTTKFSTCIQCLRDNWKTYSHIFTFMSFVMPYVYNEL